MEDIRIEKIRGCMETLLAVETLEFHNKNWLGQDNPTRSIQKMELIKDVLCELPDKARQTFV